mgnify:CR=1 FL=1
MSSNALTIIFSEIALIVYVLGALMYAVYTKKDELTSKLIWLTSAVMFALGGLIVFFGSGESEAFNGAFIDDEFARYGKVIILWSSAIILILSRDYLTKNLLLKFEYPILVAISVVGMMMMVSAGDLLSLYMGIELQALSLYVIAAFNRDSVRSTEAGLKYFVLGALSSGLLLYGASLIYGFSGTTKFSDIGLALGQGSTPLGLLVGLVFLISGLAFKVSAAPFHMWTPDVYEGAPTSITAFFAIVPKLAAIALIFRFCLEPFNNFYFEWTQVIFFLSLASMFLGAVAAIAQKSIKRLLAYSSIGHVGYVLIALVAASDQGIRSASIYMFIYLIMNISVFAILLSLKKSDKYVEKIDELSGLSKTNPVVSVSLAIIMLSMAGIPPFIGFFGKFYVFIAAIESQQYILAILGVLASVISAFYYLRIIKGMYFDEVIEAGNFDFNINNQAKVILLILLFIITFFIFYPSLLVGIVSGISLI